MLYNYDQKEEYKDAFKNISTKDRRRTCNEALIEIWQEKYSLAEAEQTVKEMLKEETV